MSPRRRLVPSVLAAAAAACLLLGGCSSTGSRAAAPSTPAPVPTSSARPTTSEAATTISGAATSTTATDATTSESMSGEKVYASPAECLSVAQIYGAVTSAILPVLQGRTGPTPFDAEQLSQALSMTTAGTVPAELNPDFAAFQNAAEQLRGKDLTAAAQVLNGPDVTTASNHVDKFLSDHC